ncbi:hypothetical protein GCM10007885_33110 [Methylobacterium gnaphalii]|nr:hypothetical protein GCM10007885_33110 [Methylobacterium gnaphalii]
MAGTGIVELPFKVKAMRGPGSEVALAVSTSGLLPIARPKPASADPKAPPAPAPDETEVAPVAVVWGDDGGAVLSLDGETVKTTLIGAEAIEGLIASETPRGAVPGSRRALSGPLSAYLSGAIGGGGQAAGLTLRERQPLGTTSEPKAVPVASVTLAPGADQAFAARRPRIAMLDGKPAVLAVTAGPGAASALVLAEKSAGETWTLAARMPLQAGATPLALAGVGDFSGKGRPQFATVREPDAAGVLQLWSYAGGAFSLVAEAPGYAGPTADIELAAVVPGEPGKAAGLALPASDRTTLAIVSLDGGIAERTRILLPGPAALGVAVLGRGERVRVLVGLADGRLAVARASAGTSVRP